MTFALAGNQNSGKTTLFNQLTGSNQHVGNWPGVTVERKTGTLIKHKNIQLVDLPGIYSLSPYTLEEVVSRDFLTSNEVDVIVNIVDATNLERNLYLTLQLCELGKPMVIALNMMDEALAHGDVINFAEFQKELGIPVVPISARNGDGIPQLIVAMQDAAVKKTVPPLNDICEGYLHEAIHSITHLVEAKSAATHLPRRYVATKLVEGDAIIQDKLGLDNHEKHIIQEIVELMEHKMDLESDAALADARYTFVSHLVNEHIRRGRKAGEMTLSNKIDRVLTNKIAAIPCFVGIMAFVFWFTFGPIGTFIADSFAGLLDLITGTIGTALESANASDWVQGLVVDGVLAGIFSMLGFLPVILLLFLFLSILEDTGYMARAAFVMDRFLSRFGLSGRAFFPMIMGFGCSVPAIMATRTMSSAKERRLAILVTPFMSCAARVPIYGLFIAAFFDTHAALVMTAIYFIGIVVAVLCAFFFKDLKFFKSGQTPFVMELPPYRLPSLKTVLLLLVDKAGDFMKRAFTVIFAATVVIWFLSSFDSSFKMVEDDNDSLLADVGTFISPVFKPLGFGEWEASTAILTGFTAKEAVVSTMAVLYNTEEDSLHEVLRSVFTPLTAWSFMVFKLLYMPCVSAFAATKRELGKLR